MMIVMVGNATAKQVDDIVRKVEEQGLKAHLSQGAERAVIGVVGDGRSLHKDPFLHMPGVDRVVPISRPYKLASREFHPADTVVDANGLRIGSGEVVLVAGPCSVEDRSQLLEAAHAVRQAGAHALRGGAFKPRTSPYSFQGLGQEGLEILAEAREATGLPVVTEAMTPEQVPLVCSHADVVQIGARNMQNFGLLHAVGQSQHPVLLKRSMMGSVNEFLMAAEYILSHGNRQVVLCERGIRTFETSTRNTTDINAVPVLNSLTHLPVIVDPSHSTGYSEYVTPVARAGIAAGADGLIVEVHPNPEAALSDGGQSLEPERFAELVTQVRAVAEAVGRSVAPPLPRTAVLRGPEGRVEGGVSGAGAKADSESLLAESRVAVVGLGLMGGSLALALRGRCAALLGSDPDPAVVKAALRLHVVDRASTEPGDILPDASLVILAAPVRPILDLIRSLPKLHPGRAVVLDVGSTKAAIHRALAALPERLEAVGGHPMCGKETPGLHRADATLFRGAKFALTACAGTTPAGRRLAEEVVGAVGAEALWLDPELHDAWTAATSHMPYLLSCGLALATPGEAAPLVGPGFRSTSRLALSDPTMMTDILATNRTAVLEALERFRRSLQTLTDRLSREDWDELGKVLEEASAARRRIEPATGTSD